MEAATAQPNVRRIGVALKPPENALTLSGVETWVYRLLLPALSLVVVVVCVGDSSWWGAACSAGITVGVIAWTRRMRVVRLGGDGHLYVRHWWHWIAVSLNEVADVDETMQRPDISAVRVRFVRPHPLLGTEIRFLTDGGGFGEESGAASALRMSVPRPVPPATA